MKTNNLIILLLLTTLFKGIFWSAVVPIWHIPDEQAHFAQVQYYAEMKKGINTKLDMSQEAAESQQLLGTLRDKRGNNKFTFHPEYRIKYTNTTTGLYEKTINSLPKSARTNFVKKEAAQYPPLFYILSSIGYLLANPFNLFIRLTLTRFISVLFGVLTVWVSFLLARSVFPKNFLLSLSIATLVSFQPMFTFLSSGVNNDNLLNLLSTALLWVMVDSIRNGLNTKRSLLMGSFLGLGIITKQTIYPFIPLPLLVIAYELLVRKKDLKKTVKKILLFLLAGLLMGGVFFVGKWIESGKLPYWPAVNPQSPRYAYTFAQYLSDKLPQLYRETLPWYWGVFNWLGVVLPLNILRLIKIGLGFSVIGLFRYLLTKIKKPKLSTKDWQLLFLLFSSIWFIMILLLWDYMLIRSIGFSHGLQGRNFFPNLAAHMTLMGFGFWNLNQRFKNQLVKLSVLAMIVLNFVGLKTVLASYYQLAPLSTLVLQASQYKPWFFKGVGLIIWFIVFITILGKFIYKLILVEEKR